MPDKGPALGDMQRVTWHSLTHTITDKRRVGQKDGPNIVLARFKPEPDGRARRVKANVLTRTGIALDCESDKKTGEIPPDPSVVIERLQAKGWAAVLYTSHSHTPDAPRYRVVLPISDELPPLLPAPEVVADALGLSGVLDRSKLGAASVFYLPSAALGSATEHQAVTVDGAPIDATWMREHAGKVMEAREAAQSALRAEVMREAEKRRQAKVKAAGAKGLKPTDKLIESIRDRLDLAGELTRHGYEKRGDRYIYAGSESGIPGVHILAGNDGVERVFSHHSGDPLAAENLPAWCTVKAVDAVDVVAILDFGGDQRKALHELAKRFNIGEPLKAKAPPPEPNGFSGIPPADDDRPSREQPPQGATSAESESPPPRVPASDDVAAVVEDFNVRYMLVNEQGKAVILQPGFDLVLRRRTYDRLTVRDLQTFYMNKLVKVGEGEDGKAILKTAADVWLRHRDRRQFIHGVTFDPTSTKARPGVLNLWEGFAVKPKLGDWSKMRWHIEHVMCGGVTEHSDYAIKWMARLVQRPAEQGEVAVVLKGVEGCGKGFVARALARIVGQHGIAISNAKHLVGNFNAHLRDSIFLFADEAFFAGDRSHTGVLKALITEPHLTIEGKFQNATSAPNFLHVMMASNEDWVVPASIEARRFFVLNVLATKAGDHAYFAALHAEMEDGGYEAMLHDLLAIDLSTFNVRSFPTTEGLQEQRKLSLPTTEAWWLDCLERGYVFRSKVGLEADFAKWYPKITMELLLASYMEFAHRASERRLLTREVLGRFFSQLGARVSRWRGGVVGEAIIDVENIHGGTNRKAALVKHQDRATGYDLGALSVAREAFTKHTGLAVSWDDGEIDDEPA